MNPLLLGLTSSLSTTANDEQMFFRFHTIALLALLSGKAQPIVRPSRQLMHNMFHACMKPEASHFAKALLSHMNTYGICGSLFIPEASTYPHRNTYMHLSISSSLDVYPDNLCDGLRIGLKSSNSLDTIWQSIRTILHLYPKKPTK